MNTKASGGLLLILAVLAGTMAVVEKPAEPVRGGRLPGILQTTLPPGGGQPPSGDRRDRAARRHPRSHRPASPVGPGPTSRPGRCRAGDPTPGRGASSRLGHCQYQPWLSQNDLAFSAVP